MTHEDWVSAGLGFAIVLCFIVVEEMVRWVRRNRGYTWVGINSAGQKFTIKVQGLSGEQTVRAVHFQMLKGMEAGGLTMVRFPPF